MKREILDSVTGRIVTDMLNYGRVYTNHSEEEAARHFGITAKEFSLLENDYTGVDSFMLPQIELYLGFDPDSLEGHISNVVDTVDSLPRAIGERIIPAIDNRTVMLRGRLHVNRGFHFEPESRYGGVEKAQRMRLTTPDLPFARIYLNNANIEALVADGKVDFVGRLLSAPFQAVHNIYQSKKKILAVT